MAKRPIVLCLALCLMAGILFTWPMASSFFSSIPYTLKPIPGYERVPLIPGDHLQAYYWYWLLSDNLFGGSTFLSNPYEFNGPAGPMSTVSAFFPFSLLYIILLPLGPIGAYNGLILLSFVLCGLSMFLLARTWTNDPWSSLLAGLIFAVFPYRISHIAGGQLTGHVIFFLPLCLFFVEKTLTTGRWVYGGAAGLCLVLLSRMDPHTSYLTALTLGVYLPSRLLLNRPFPLIQGRESTSLWPGFIGTLAGGLSISFFLWIRYGLNAGLPFWHTNLIQAFILGTLLVFFAWFYLSALLSRWTTLSFAETRLRVGKIFLLFLPLWFYVLKYRIHIPYLGLILTGFSLSLFFIALIAVWKKHRDRLLMFDWPKTLILVISVGLGLAIASAYLMHVRTTVFLPSLAGKGRTIGEVLLFSPRAGNLFFWQDINQERFVLLGWGLVLLAVFGLIPLFKQQPKRPGQLALAGILAFLGLILTLGPTLTSFPLYSILYRYVPFFNYSRVPGRFVMVGMVFFCLLAGMALSSIRESLASRGWNRLRKWLPLFIILLVLAEFHTWQPLGISMMGKDNRIYKEIQNRLPKGGNVLELPIWPGDSHQSSAYEYTVTRTRKPMINGYAPVVFREYIRHIFWPLFPLDFGELKSPQAAELKNLKVDLITFHDNSMVYPEKISPFPPRLALKRLITSPFLRLVDHDQDVSLFKFNSDFLGAPSDYKNLPTLPLAKGWVKNPPMTKEEGGGFREVSTISSPVSAIFYAHQLSRETGSVEMDPLASGYYLLMDEKALLQGKLVPLPGKRGNVFLASPGQDQSGYLAIGPSRFFPSGKYKARFRIKAGAADPWQEVGRIEITKDRKTVIKQRLIRGRDINGTAGWTDIPLEFENTQLGEIGFRVYYSGKVPLKFNTAAIGFADQNTGPGSVEAEDLFRQTGTVILDPLASGKEAVFGQAGYHPPIYLSYGPYRTFPPGRFQAVFFLRLKDLPSISKETDVVLIEVATDMGKRIFSQRKVKVRDLITDQYEPIRLDVKVPFPCELGYRVKFLSKVDVLLDRMEVVDAQKGMRGDTIERR
ncbi:MAG: hypothetical protein ACYC56_13500 [Candidatus Aquicultor sp.]